MKLSFSTKGWHGIGFIDFIKLAKELSYDGIELHNIHNEYFASPKGEFCDGKVSSTLRKLYENKLEIPCIDAISDLSSDDSKESIDEIIYCINLAKSIHCEYVRIKAKCKDDSKEDNIKTVIDNVLPIAEKNNITLLIESSGLYSFTQKLRNILEFYANDYLAASWNLSSQYIVSGEKPNEVIKNLGAFVKHVHYTDVKILNGKEVNVLAGRGIVPIVDVMYALNSVNYNGYISLVWDKDKGEINDMELIFSQFIAFVKSFGDTYKNKKTLYFNKTHTGNFVWKKEILISETFPQVLDRMCEEFPDQYAFKYTTLNYTRTYVEFREDVDRFARALVHLGVKKGSKVAVWATNVPEWYIAFWATTKIGAVLVTVNTAYKIHEAEYLLKQSDTHTLILVESNLDSNYSNIIGELCPELETKKSSESLHARRLPFLRNVITVGFKKKGCLTFEEANKLSDKVPIEEVYRRAKCVNKDDVCNMQYTSGTTGFPKGVMLTHYNIVNNGKCIGDRMDLSTADRMMIQVPMFHCFGMVLSMTASMTHGVTMSPLPYFSAKSSLACINQEHITCFNGVPTMFIAMLEHPDFATTDFSYMRTGIMAGSPCPIATMNDVTNKMNMKEITIVYGQTEAAPGCTMSSTDDSIEVRVGTVGRPLPEIECKIINPETGEDMPDETNGEFVARGYNIMKGYYKMPDATNQAIDKDGWLHTGDLALRTKEGNYKITGRLKDMIIRGGENIYPKEIEEFIYTNPKVRDVQVIGVPDEQYGEEIMACIILKENETMTEDEMKKFIMASMARHKVPKYIQFVDNFPMNAAGKILKYKMREDAIISLGLTKASKIVTA